MARTGNLALQGGEECAFSSLLEVLTKLNFKFRTSKMKIAINLKLKPTEDQAKILFETLEVCNNLCNAFSRHAFETKNFNQFSLHQAKYHETRESSELSSQMVVRCIAKVSDSYRADRTTLHVFRKWAAQPYDDRIFSFKEGDQVSLWTLSGRMKIPFVCGEHQRKYLRFRKGEVDLVYGKHRKKWFVNLVCDIPEQEPEFSEKVLGVDFGIVHIATDSEGEVFSGTPIENKRLWYQERRKRLQKKKTKASKRRLIKLSGKQARFQTWVNHNISQHLVSKAKRTRSGIAVEDLSGIRDGVTARKSQRNRLHNWSFDQLRSFVSDKSRRKGVALFVVDPRNTSRTCPECGCVDKKNRKSQDRFSCIACDYSALSDYVAARNIAKVAVNRPEFPTRRKAG
ncbi:MAG: transposase [Nitrospirae bacterium]|nr:transposase [Nitrospirota bacterium]